MNRTLISIIYLIVFLVSFVFFTVAKLPVDAIVGHYLAEIEESNKGEVRVMMGKRKINLLFDSVIEDVHIQKKTANGYQDIFYASKLEFGVSYIRAIMGDYSVSFALKMAQGKMSGDIFWSEDKRVIRIGEMKNISFADLGFLKEVMPAEFMGSVSGEMMLSFGAEPALEKSSAKIVLKLTSLQMAETPLKKLGIEIPPPFNTWFKDPVPRLILSADKPALVDIVMDQGKIQFNRLELTGTDIELLLKGKLTINSKKNKGTYLGALDMQLKVSPTIETDYEQIFAMFENEKDGEGFYGITVKGDIFNAASYTVGKTQIGEVLKNQGL